MAAASPLAPGAAVAGGPDRLAAGPPFRYMPQAGFGGDDEKEMP
jgi:hypothetical protein